MPTIMKTTYMLDDGSATVLGEESSSGINEVLYPDADFSDHVMTITKKFDSSTVYRWEVTGVLHTSSTDAIVMLRPRVQTQDEEYLLKTIISRRSPRLLSVLVRKGALVEVEFGYIHSVRKANGDHRSNKRYPDQAKRGEMHKRRLAVVVKANRERVQVVPITSRVPSSPDPTSFEVSAASLQRLVDYNNPAKHSYVLCGMIQTISPARILPPKSIDHAQKHVKRNVNYPNQLTLDDMKKLEVALSSAVGICDYTQVRKERNDLKTARNADLLRLQEQGLEKAVLEQQVADLLAEHDQLKIYKALLWDMYKGCKPNLNPEELELHIEEEVIAYRELLAV